MNSDDEASFVKDETASTEGEYPSNINHNAKDIVFRIYFYLVHEQTKIAG